MSSTRMRLLIRNICLVALPMLSPILLLGIFSTTIVQGELTNEIQANYSQILQQNTQAVESIFGAVDLIGSNFDTSAKNQQLLKSILNQPRTLSYTQEEYNNISFITNMLRSYLSANTYVYSIYLYVNNPYQNVFYSNGLIMDGNQIHDTEWLSSYQSMKIDQTYLIRSNVIKEYEYESGTVPCITIGRQIQNTSYSNSKTGVVVVNFRKSMIDEILKNNLSTLESALFVLDKDGKILAGTSQINKLTEETISTADFPDKGVFEWSFNGHNYICFSDTSSIHPIRLVSLIPKESFYKHSTDIFTITLVLLLASFVLGSCISYFIARSNDRSLSLILATIKAAEEDAPLPIGLSRPKNDYEYLLQNMISVFIKQNALRTQLAEKKYTLRTMELNILQAQINPHFLYNTLRTIFWKTVSLTAAPNEASHMIEYLSDILYFVLSVPGYKVALKQEINHAESYLSIQRIRYNDKFSVVWHYDEALVNSSVMKFCLQPILENSILHGIDPGKKVHYGIKISFRKKEGKLHIRITDNGTGMDAERLRMVRASLEEEGNSELHIGIKNVKKRLFLLYNKRSVGFMINSKPNIGTSVHMYFPYEEYRDPQAEQ